MVVTDSSCRQRLSAQQLLLMRQQASIIQLAAPATTESFRTLVQALDSLTERVQYVLGVGGESSV